MMIMTIDYDGQVEGVTVDTNTSQLLSLGGRWQHSLNIVDTRLDTSGQFRRVQEKWTLSRIKTLQRTVSGKTFIYRNKIEVYFVTKSLTF